MHVQCVCVCARHIAMISNEEAQNVMKGVKANFEISDTHNVSNFHV